MQDPPLYPRNHHDGAWKKDCVLAEMSSTTTKAATHVMLADAVDVRVAPVAVYALVRELVR